jgi:hypothetical protein
MTEQQHIIICFELDTGLIRETRDQWCRPQSNDIVINSVFSERGICSINAALEEPQFLADQERVRNELTSYVNALRNTHPKLAELLTANAPQIFEHNLHELHKWAYTLKNSINTSCYKIKVMFPHAHSANHLFLFEAEGETSATRVRSALYKRTDFMTQLLREFAVSLGVDHSEYSPSPTILSRWSYHARRITRTFGMVIARGLLHSRNAVRHHRNIPLRSPALQSELLVIVRSVIHAEFFSNLLKDHRTMCLVQDGLGVYPKVFQRTKVEGASQIIHCYDLVTPSKIIKLTLQVLRELFAFTLQARQDMCPYVFTLDGMLINMSTIIKECIASSLDTKLLATAISTIASRAECRLKGVAHSELFTAYPQAIKATSDKFCIPTLQFAFGTYEMRPVPDFIHSDRFFCFSLDQRESILRMANAFDPTHVCYAGNLLIDSSKNCDQKRFDEREEALKNVILYYSQPFDDAADDALVSVMRITDAMNLSLKVVMHPREHTEKFVKYGDDLCILTNEMYIEQRPELFKKTLFAITRNSNVGYQLLLRNIPLINYLTTTKDALVKHEYYEGFPLLVRSEEQLVCVLESAEEYIDKYRIFRDSYIERSFLHQGASHVISTIFEANDVNK